MFWTGLIVGLVIGACIGMVATFFLIENYDYDDNYEDHY